MKQAMLLLAQRLSDEDLNDVLVQLDAIQTARLTLLKMKVRAEQKKQMQDLKKGRSKR